MAPQPAFADHRLMELLVSMNLMEHADKYAVVETQFNAWVASYAAALQSQQPPVTPPAGFSPQDFLQKKYEAGPDGQPRVRANAMEYAAFDAMEELKKSSLPDAVKNAVKVPFIGEFITATIAKNHRLEPQQAAYVVETAAAFQAGAQVSGIVQALADGDIPLKAGYAVKVNGVPSDRRVDDARDPTTQQFQATVSVLSFLAKAAELKPDLKPQVQQMAQQVAALGQLQQRVAVASLTQYKPLRDDVQWLENYFPPIGSKEVAQIQGQIGAMQAALAQQAMGVMQVLKQDAAITLPDELKSKMAELEGWVGKRASQAAQAPHVVPSHSKSPRNLLERAWNGFWSEAKQAMFTLDDDGHIQGVSPQGVLTIGGVVGMAIGAILPSPNARRDLARAGGAAALVGVADSIFRAANYETGGGILDRLVGMRDSSPPDKPLPPEGKGK